MKKILFFMPLIVASVFSGSFSWYRSVPVIKSKAIYRSMTIRTPYRECRERQVPVYRNTLDEPVAMLIGGAAGGVLGHQIGSGHGRDVATVGGVIVGALVGENLARQSRMLDYHRRRVCETRYREHRERRFVHYKNIARFRGHRIVKFSNRPLRSINVKLAASY